MAGIAGPPGLGAVAVAKVKPCSTCDSRAHRGVGFIYIFSDSHGLSNLFASAMFLLIYNVGRAQSEEDSCGEIIVSTRFDNSPRFAFKCGQRSTSLFTPSLATNALRSSSIRS